MARPKNNGVDNTSSNKRVKNKSSVVKSCKGCKLIESCYRIELDDYRCWELDNI